MKTTRRDFLCQAAAGTGLAVIASGAGCGAARPVVAADPTTAFFHAVQRGDLRSVSDQLADRPRLLEARDSDGRSGFGLALVVGHGAVADLIRSRGYQPDLVESAWIGDWERFEHLANGDSAAVNAVHPLGGTAMYAAAMGGRGSELWRVYAQCGEPNPDRAPTAFSPLRAAFEVPDLGAAEMTAATLLANGADPNAREPGDSSALHAAARRGSVALVEMLVRKRAEVRASNHAGLTPVEVAERAGHAAVVAVLSEHGAIPRDHTALRRAFDVDGRPYRPPSLSDISVVEQRSFVTLGHGQFAELRRRFEADPRLVHAMATTTEMAVDASGHTGRVEITNYLLDRGAPYSMPSAVLRGDRGQVEALLDREPDRIHERGPHDFALLWYPVLAGGAIDLAELLIQRGARIDEQHFMGTTALHFAALHGQRDMVAFLLERGARIDRVGRKFDARGQTPYQLALSRGQTAVVELLAERGARSG